MKCYNHNDRDAFGICKYCGKGLCLDCLKETDFGIVCKDSIKCEESAAIGKYSLDLIKKQAFSKKRKWLTFFTGLAFLLAGAVEVTIHDIVMITLGCGMIFLGILFMLAARSMGIQNNICQDCNSENKISFAKYLWIIVVIMVLVFTLVLFSTPIQ